MRKCGKHIIFLMAMWIILLAPLQAQASNRPRRPENVKAAAGVCLVKLSWEPVRGADYYYVYQYNAKLGKFSKIKRVSQTAYTVRSLKPGKKYRFEVRAFAVKDGEIKKSPYSRTVNAIPAPEVKKARNLRAEPGENSAVLSWDRVSGASGYSIYQYDGAKGKYIKILSTTKKTTVIKNLKQGKSYRFRVRTRKRLGGRIYYSKYSAVLKVKMSKEGEQERSTLKKFLQTAMQPVGKTMYVWGGGWNEEDTAAGIDARTIGVSPAWEKFFERQTSGYDYNQTRYQIRNGLDCSGYVGWCIYNILNTTSGNQGYVMKAEAMASTYASWGWGQYIGRFQVRDYMPGDIMSSACSDCGHVWIVVGTCQDGSVVLVHCSPQGVQINGTVNRYGSYASGAVGLADSYMKTYYPRWYQKYPDCARGESYLSHYGQMRWDVSGNAVMTDPEGYRGMSAAEILRDLF